VEKALGDRPVWELNDKVLERVETVMMDYARPRLAGR
jgi:hypothetical protein